MGGILEPQNMCILVALMAIHHDPTAGHVPWALAGTRRGLLESVFRSQTELRHGQCSISVDEEMSPFRLAVCQSCIRDVASIFFDHQKRGTFPTTIKHNSLKRLKYFHLLLV